MSQVTDINLENKTVTIDEVQLEHIDKGLRNEQLQRKEIKELKEIVSKKDSIIASLELKYQSAIEKVFSLSNSILENQKDITDITQDELDTEKKKRNTGLYAFSRVTGNKNELHSFDFGLSLVTSKMLFSVSVDPLSGTGSDANGVFFGAGVGFKLF